MSLYLVEFSIEAGDRTAVTKLIEQISEQASSFGAEIVESQVTKDLSRLYVIVEADACAGIRFDVPDTTVTAGPDVVRLVGADLEQVKSAKLEANYLVEWDIPNEIGMDAYLARKKEKAPLYASVPEVSFLRTYVREDTAKCLCFYDGPDEAAVRRARDVVSTPVSRLYALDDKTA